MTDSLEQRLQGVREAAARYEKSVGARKKADASGGEATDSSYGIVFSVGGGGKFKELKLGPEALRLSPSLLASRILACARMAELNYGRTLQEAVEESFAGDDFSQSLISEIHKRYPELDEEEGEETREHARGAMTTWEREAVDRTDDDDDDGWQGSILRS